MALAVALWAVLSFHNSACGGGEDSNVSGGYGGTGGTGATGGAGTGGTAGVPEDACPGKPHSVTLTGGPVVENGTTAGLHDDMLPYCTESASAPDAVYAVTTKSAGTLTVTLKSGGGTAQTLYLRTTCDSPVDPLGCVSGSSPAGTGGTGGTGDSGLADSADASEGLDAADSSSVDASPVPDAPVPDVSLGGAAGTGAGGTAGGPAEASSPIGELTLRLNVAAEQQLYAIVDGSGPFELTFSLAAGKCGDSVVNADEDCDFGDASPGDGCAADCKFEPAGPADVCGNVVTTLPDAFSGHTIGYADNYSAVCGAFGGGRDAAFGFFTSKPGTLQAKAKADFDIVLSVYSSCVGDTLSGLLGCADSPDQAGAEENLQSHVGPGTYFVVVDGFDSSSSGKFQLSLDFTAD